MNPLEALTFVGYTPSKNECVVVCIFNAKTLREAAARFFATQKGIDNPPCGIVAVFSGMLRC